MNSLDVQDWELLPNDGFLDDEGSKNQSTTLPNSDTTAPASLVNYFFTPPKSTSNQKALEPKTPNQEDEDEDEDEDEEYCFFKKTNDGRAEFQFGRDSFNIWKLSLFGVAAAGVCIIISWGNSNKQHQQINQKRHHPT